MPEAAGPESTSPSVGERVDDPFGPPGTQTLVRAPTDVDPLSVLPERAYDNLLMVTLCQHPRKLQRRVEDGGHDPTDVGVLPVVPVVDEYEGDLRTTDSVSPDDLTGVGMRFSDAARHLESGTGWVLVDAVGVLFMYAPTSRVCRFLQTLADRVRTMDVCGAYCVDPDAVSDETDAQLQAMYDFEYDAR